LIRAALPQRFGHSVSVDFSGNDRNDPFVIHRRVRDLTTAGD
jgi:hypothetical protein